MITGGCFCGNIRYTLAASSYRSAACHCTMCRRTSGAPFVVWLMVPTSEFSYSAGQPAVLESSAGGTRYFCPACGTPIACVVAAHPDIIDITLGSLDDPTILTPGFEAYTDTRLEWVADIPGAKHV